MTGDGETLHDALRFFSYEEAYREDLRFIPMLLRYKLDLTGRSISLDEWKALPLEERRALVDAPVSGDAERDAFARRIDAAAGTSPAHGATSIVPVSMAAWSGLELPQPVAERASESGMPIDASTWRRLRPFERYALAKLGGGEKKSRNFDSVLAELTSGSAP